MLQNQFSNLDFLSFFKNVFFSSFITYSITHSGQNLLISLWYKFKMSSRNDNLSLFQHGNVVSPDVSNVPSRIFKDRILYQGCQPKGLYTMVVLLYNTYTHTGNIGNVLNLCKRKSNLRWSTLFSHWQNNQWHTQIVGNCYL